MRRLLTLLVTLALAAPVEAKSLKGALHGSGVKVKGGAVKGGVKVKGGGIKVKGKVKHALH